VTGFRKNEHALKIKTSPSAGARRFVKEPYQMVERLRVIREVLDEAGQQRAPH